MNKMLVAVFDNDTAAFEGVTALKDLHSSGDISLYAIAVIGKDQDGKIEEKQVADEGPIGSVLGMFTGAMVGLLAGPGGMALGATLGGLTGMLFDLQKAGVDVEFLADVADAMKPGSCAILANLDEGWTTPVDSRLGEHGATIHRRLRGEVEEDQMARESAALSAEWEELKHEMKEDHEENKEKLEASMASLKTKMNDSIDRMQAKIDADKKEADAKMAALKEQAEEANDKMKAKIDKRMEKVKEDHEKRKAKLEESMEKLKSKFSD